MVLDQQLLERARAEGRRLTEAERQAQLTRAEYHTAVRRLHLAGGSLRQIAQALGLSHQRVQQIVDEAGGTWWQRVWRTRNRRDAVCTYCGRPPSEVDKLIAGPNVFICDRCTAAAEKSAADAGARGGFAPAKHRLARCGFCGKIRSAARPIVASGGTNVCGECLAVCREILEGRRG